ncbi:MAG: pilin [Burkholderiaceae bacterium]|nr:pilin [Burkholderiaceae bacterium]
MTEALVSVEPAKLNVLEVLASGNPNASTDGYGQGYTSPEASRNLQRVDIDAVTGMITVTTTANAGGGTLTLMPYTGTALPGTPLPPGKGVFTPPEQPAKWRCAAQGTTNLATGQQAGSLAARFAPAECK